MNDEMKAVSGTLMLLDRMIRIQGLERTLEQVREVNKLNINFNMIDNQDPQVLKAAWRGCLITAALTNTKVKE